MTNKTTRILHGIHAQLFNDPTSVKSKLKLANHHVLLTFGLLSRNKGLEYVIKSLPEIKKQVPDVLYVIVGATHPGVIRHEGEAYRDELKVLIKKLSLEANVKFIADYQPLDAILEYLQATDIYISSSLDAQQTVSGTLSYALGAGRAVISTNFSQAQEIVTLDVGRVVPIGNSKAFANATIELFNNPKLLETMHHSAYSLTRSMLWSNVADDYIALLAELSVANKLAFTRWPNLNWSHLQAMSASFGMLQFSKATRPDQASGYTLDDNSRALQLIYQANQLNLLPKKKYNNLAKKYLAVMSLCLMNIPAVNYLSAKTKKPTKQNLEENLSDSLSRAYYALQTVRNSLSATDNKTVVRLLDVLPSILDTSYIHSAAQVLLGAVTALQAGDQSARDLIDTLSAQMIKSYKANSLPDWQWFDKDMTYANGQLCSSLLDSANVTGSLVSKKVGLTCLEFLCNICFMGEVYVPIGQSGWRNQSGFRALFDQQPEDVLAMIQALDSAYQLTGDKKYIFRARKAFSWFLGNNLVGARVYDDKTGGCHDGLKPNGLNVNEGAESTLSYLGSRLIMERLASVVV